MLSFCSEAQEKLFNCLGLVFVLFFVDCFEFCYLGFVTYQKQFSKNWKSQNFKMQNAQERTVEQLVQFCSQIVLSGVSLKIAFLAGSTGNIVVSA